MAREGTDPEGVHQLRVAAQRLRVWLELGGRADPGLRELRTRAGSVRDLDVQLLAGPPPLLAGWLLERRAQSRPRLAVWLDGPAVPRLLGALEDARPLTRAEAEAGLAEVVARSLRRGEGLTTGSHEADFHRLRRAVRRVRYALEWLGRSDAAVRGLHKRLGALNDLAVTLAMVEASPYTGELAGFREELRGRLVAAKVMASEAWVGHAEGLAELAERATPELE